MKSITEGMTPMNFGEAWKLLAHGKELARKAWLESDARAYVRLKTPRPGGSNTMPYFFKEYMPTKDYPATRRVPWIPSNEELFAKDWVDVWQQ